MVKKMINEKRAFDLKNLCNKKWRVDNPDGYFGQMRHGSVREASDWMCRLAGFKNLEEADVYFRTQSEVNTKKMIRDAEIIESKRPATTPAQQEYIRKQLHAGLEGTEVSDKPPKTTVGLVVLVFGFMAAAWLLLMGRR